MCFLKLSFAFLVLFVVSIDCNYNYNHQHRNDDFEFIEDDDKFQLDTNLERKDNNKDFFYDLDEDDDLENDEIMEQLSRCKACDSINATLRICGSDGRTYDSMCQLNLTNCLNESKVTVSCQHPCPCKVKKITKYDQNRKYLLKKYRYYNDGAITQKVSTKPKKSIVKNRKELNTNEANEVFVQRKDHNTRCKTIDAIKSMGTRLLEWFIVLMNDPMNSIRQKHTKINRQFPKYCKREVKWMYDYLDTNSDGLLEPNELHDLENYPYETCLRPFLLSCDFNEDARVSMLEWCHCFATFERKFMKQNLDNFVDLIDDDDNEVDTNIASGDQSILDY